MSSRIIPAEHGVNLSRKWPSTPTAMTFSKLIAIESCPMAWALDSASYPDLWNKQGYPRKPSLEGIIGRVIHLALDRITKAFIDDSCPSVFDPIAVTILKKMGGYSGIINSCIQFIVEQENQNPRFRQAHDALTLKIHSQVSSIREKLQILLTRRGAYFHSGFTIPGSQHDRMRKPLRPGFYSEVKLTSQILKWTGVADLLRISDSQCEIVDFKTGQYSNNHVLQIKIYNVLWAHEEKLNPENRLVDKLTLSYVKGNIDIPPLTSTELNALANELSERTHIALGKISHFPPKPHPDPNLCCQCNVRHFCEVYWSDEIQRLLVQQMSDHFCDFQLRILQKHGLQTWDSVIEASSKLPIGTSVFVRTGVQNELLRPGDRIRILGANLTHPSDKYNSEIMININKLSEMYIID